MWKSDLWEIRFCGNQIWGKSILEEIRFGGNQIWVKSDFGGNQNCVMYDPRLETIGDQECSEEWVSFCQVSINTVFQLSGICSLLDVDDTYILLTVSILFERFNTFSINHS